MSLKPLRLRRSAWLLLAGLAMPFWSGGAAACVEGDLRGEAVTIEKDGGAPLAGGRADMQIIGAGWVRAVTIEKEGGTTDDTWVTIELDGEPMISTSFALLKNAWNQLSTSSISASAKTVGTKSVLTIWYAPELKFRAIANVRVEVNEEGVENVLLRTIMNKPAPHEHIPGTGTQVAMPAFK